jgi:hypothetical protein
MVVIFISPCKIILPEQLLTDIYTVFIQFTGTLSGKQPGTFNKYSTGQVIIQQKISSLHGLFAFSLSLTKQKNFGKIYHIETSINENTTY